ncbi:hypothetical protein LFML04_0666 [Leptospirillum ferriphilum ML-04]|uniref:Lipoprotein n=1 Tax=Leptospirillum ferriphilum (strain ML-04) TaxID=1048260 RepID=J9Z9S0_LEPFM|nr:hypothetical protein LFML04_0666 [Leptospirillum ferriphilum ML-04]
MKKILLGLMVSLALVIGAVLVSCSSVPPDPPVQQWTVLFGEQVFVCESVPLQPKNDVTIDCVPKYH